MSIEDQCRVMITDTMRCTHKQKDKEMKICFDHLKLEPNTLLICLYCDRRYKQYYNTSHCASCNSNIVKENERKHKLERDRKEEIKRDNKRRRLISFIKKMKILITIYVNSNISNTIMKFYVKEK